MGCISLYNRNGQERVVRMPQPPHWNCPPHRGRRHPRELQAVGQPGRADAPQPADAAQLLLPPEQLRLQLRPAAAAAALRPPLPGAEVLRALRRPAVGLEPEHPGRRLLRRWDVLPGSQAERRPVADLPARGLPAEGGGGLALSRPEHGPVLVEPDAVRAGPVPGQRLVPGRDEKHRAIGRDHADPATLGSQPRPAAGHSLRPLEDRDYLAGDEDMQRGHRPGRHLQPGDLRHLGRRRPGHAHHPHRMRRLLRRLLRLRLRLRLPLDRVRQLGGLGLGLGLRRRGRLCGHRWRLRLGPRRPGRAAQPRHLRTRQAPVDRACSRHGLLHEEPAARRRPSL